MRDEVRKYAIIFIIVLITLSGCMGTGSTRLSTGGSWAGKYPGQAVAVDVVAMFGPAKNPYVPPAITYPLHFIVGVISLPIDMAVDAVLLPIDLALWPLGFSKSYGFTDK